MSHNQNMLHYSVCKLLLDRAQTSFDIWYNDHDNGMLSWNHTKCNLFIQHLTVVSRLRSCQLFVSAFPRRVCLVSRVLTSVVADFHDIQIEFPLGSCCYPPCVPATPASPPL